jgi:hypothetical protein
VVMPAFPRSRQTSNLRRFRQFPPTPFRSAAYFCSSGFRLPTLAATAKMSVNKEYLTVFINRSLNTLSSKRH